MSTSSRRTRAESPSVSHDEHDPAPEPREPRRARRKRETHEKLLRAAFGLIAERGADGVAVNEITKTADVGFGSFYNHFDSKEAIHAAAFGTVFEVFGDALARLTGP
jgi:AcrR family transcriptional regulator